MTMDVGHRSGKLLVVDSTTPEDVRETKVVKRSFDVAFLMLPDDKLKQKQLRAARQSLVPTYEHTPGSSGCLDDDEDKRSDDSESPGFLDLQRMQQNHAKYLSNIAQLSKHHQQIFGDPSLVVKVGNNKTTEHFTEEDDVQKIQKSAFTKVPSGLKEQRMSPNLSISPDLSYQNSLSPSPPIIRHQFHQQFQQGSQFHAKQQYHNAFLHQDYQGSSSSSNQNLMDFATKMRPVLPYTSGPIQYTAYPAFPPPAEMLKMSSGDGRNSIFSSLLPPSLAALSLPAQNVCAKCNISFRMTSDLVYHMRSHHKNDIANDMSKRRREEKLKCPVCAESFRERHHLTRHMTAHQDKEGDALDGDEVQCKKKALAAASSANFGGVYK